jgi:hypothetical protein
MKRPHRVIHIGHTESKGEDVDLLRAGVHRDLDHLKLGFLFQMRTPASRRHTIARCVFALGLSDREHKAAIQGKVGKATQRKIRNPALRNPVDRVRANRRKHRLKKWRVDHRKDSHVTVMFDSVEAHLIPTDAPAVAGYVDGAFENYNELKDRFPHAKHASIAVRSSSDADILDVERGDASPDQVPDWVKRQLNHRKTGAKPGLYNTKKPVAYGAVSTVVEIVHHLRMAGLLDEVELLSAHVGQGEHICGPKTCGYPQLDIDCGGCQWLWTHDFDKSKLKPTFF